MDRWTMQELEQTDDLDFSICILNERRAKITPYSPLGIKLSKAVHTLHNIKEERDKYIPRTPQTAETGQEAQK